MRLLCSLAGFFLATFSVIALATTVNLNNASAKGLANQLDGVGLVKAQSIVAYRKAHGPFKTVDDLAKVKGIGPKLIEENRAHMEVGKSGN